MRARDSMSIAARLSSRRGNGTTATASFGESTRVPNVSWLWPAAFAGFSLMK